MISVQNISKSFLIPHEQKRSVKGSLFSLFNTKYYERIEVLKDFSLSVEKGEFLGIMGPNGSGKSTLLRILAGVYEPERGQVKIEGNVSSILELGVGFHPELTARENVFLNGTLLGISQAQLQKRFEHIIRFADLEAFMDTPLKHFSSGMAARLAFAVAIQVEADVYLMDEVLAVGDAEFQKKCLQVFRDFKKEGKTLVFVSHSRQLLEAVCDRIICLGRDGQ
ncbi:MAG: ABC transporter ATP-binding protein [Candidatus Altimarinota bacterium]